MPRRGFPEWMYNYPRLRFYQQSRELGSLSSSSGKVKKTNEEPRRRKPDRKTIDRIGECDKKVIFMGYDKKQDKTIITPPIWGLKKSLEHFPKSVCVEDFDFETQRPFKVYGFNDLSAVHDFESAWLRLELIAKLDSKIEAKRQKLLNQWNEVD